MKRRIIHIEESRCNGCGLCAAACHEGAIEMVNGKARLTREDYCDGLGDCLPACPTGAITFEEREAPAYDHAAVLAAKAARAADTPLPCGCPGSQSRAIRRPEAAPTAGDIPSELRQWPVQIKLAPVNAPYFDPINQIVGYILSEDPTYITNYNNARALIRKLDRDELLQELVKQYLRD